MESYKKQSTEVEADDYEYEKDSVLQLISSPGVKNFCKYI